MKASGAWYEKHTNIISLWQFILCFVPIQFKWAILEEIDIWTDITRMLLEKDSKTVTVHQQDA